MFKLKYINFLLFFCISNICFANIYHLNHGQQIIGSVHKLIIQQDHQDITDIAQKYDVGYYELVEANQQYNINNLHVGDVLIIPSKYILPNTKHIGIVVNLTEMRLYYYANSNTVYTFPIGVGRKGWDTPLIHTKIIEKKSHPTWYIPQSIKNDLAMQGISAPKSMPPGVNNPLGPYMLRLGLPTYLIHGSNDPSSVGRRSSSGCIHLYNKDITTLYKLVKINTSVNIIKEPYKFATKNHELYLEVHSPLNTGIQAKQLNLTKFVNLLQKQSNDIQQINFDIAIKTAKDESGIPTKIS